MKVVDIADEIQLMIENLDLTSRNEQKHLESTALERACESLRSSGADVLGIQCDVSDKAQVEALAITAYEHFGNVDSLNTLKIIIFWEFRKWVVSQ